MNSFEAIRENAKQLHGEVLASGADPLKPMALVEAAASILDLEIAWLAPGDPALKGARALLDQQSKAIFASNIGTEAQRAILVAHEIGHERIHVGSSNCTDDDIDPSRSVESSPVGIQRIEDYGAHERRELQANVFAREFLFPRHLAKSLFLGDSLSSEEIGRRTDLAVGLVRQQILDALLLPIPPSEGLPKAKSPPLIDTAQDGAAAHRGTAFQLQAGPGTGKTSTLVKRILSLLAEGVDPASILVLTFSNKAAAELAERVAAISPDATAKIWIGTFHAFGLDLIRRHYDKLKLPQNPVLFDKSDAIAVLEELLPTLPLVHYRNLWDPAMVLRDVLTAISRAKDEMVTWEKYRELAQRMAEKASDDDSKEAAEKCLEVADIYQRYEQAKEDHGAIDFGDIIMRPSMLLENDVALRAAVQLRHRHVLVDEYQDVNRASVRFVKALAGDAKRLWVVGDSRQSIYRFRGASSTNMSAFANDYPGSVADQLSINYRSTQQIVGAFVGFAPTMSASNGMLPLSLDPVRGKGPASPQLRSFDTLEDEGSGIASSIRELEAAGISLRDQAVLCRSNSRLNEIATALEHRGIPVLHLGSLFEREEVRDLLAILTLTIDPFGSGLVRLAAMPRYEVPLQDVHLAAKHLRETRQPVLNDVAALTKIPGISAQGLAGFSRLAEDLAGLSPKMTPWELLTTYLLDRSGLARELAEATTVAGRLRGVAIWQFLNFVREQSVVGTGSLTQRVLDRVRQLVLLAEERDLRQVPAGALHMDAVRLMTVHGSKGLEFEAIHMPGMTQASFPSSNRAQRCPPPVGMIAGAEGLTAKEEALQAHSAEEECLFFVAVSRARTHLRLYRARFQKNGKNRTVSEFLSRAPAVSEIPNPSMLPLPPDAPRPEAILVTSSTDLTPTDARLGLYQKCPRRYFYTHVLGLAGARKTTAFSQTHECLYELIRWLSASRQTGQPTLDDAKAAFESIWEEKGPKDHAFAADYRKLALRLIDTLVQSGAGRLFRESKPLAINLATKRVIIEPNEIAELPDGSIVLRRVRTGYKRSEEYDNLEYTLYLLAGEAHFGAKTIIEALHLTDGGVAETVSITPAKMKNRQGSAAGMLTDIENGAFPANVDPITCPRCPHFFICAATPKGPIDIS